MYTVRNMVKLTKRTGLSREQSDEYGTPLAIYAALNKEFRFDMDVCASARNYKHKKYLTKKEDALNPDTKWGKRNFCNPPYSDIQPWYERAVMEVINNDALTVFLSKWDHSTRHGIMALRHFKEIRLVMHRIQFEGASACCNFPLFVGVVKPGYEEIIISLVSYKDIL